MFSKPYALTAPLVGWSGWLASAQRATKVFEDSIVVMKVNHFDGYPAWPIQDACDCRHAGELVRSY
jgi:hypothetical protein